MLPSSKYTQAKLREERFLQMTAERREPEAVPSEVPHEVCVQNSSDVLDLLSEKNLSGRPLRVQMTGLLDSADIATLTWLLTREGVHLSVLDVNLSSRTDPAMLRALLALLPAHPELRSVRFCVDGSEKGPFPTALRSEFAQSKDCLLKGGAALRTAVFGPLDHLVNHAYEDTADMWAASALIDDFCAMRLDDALKRLSADDAKLLRSIAQVLHDEPLASAVDALRGT